MIMRAPSTGIDNDNESTNGLDTTVALGGPEAEGDLDDLYTAIRLN